MKTKHYLVVFLLVFSSASWLVAQLPTCDGNRYRNYVFPEVDSVLSVPFAQNYSADNVLWNMRMDIYQPVDDQVAQRPLIVFIHGGSFVSGSRKDMRPLCLDFARRGFVTATIDYRLINPFLLADSFVFADEIVKSVGDAKAAIRYFVQDAATSNIYRIDTTNIIIGGASAGGIIASHVGYLHPNDNIPAFFQNIIVSNGGFAGNSSANTNYGTPVKAVLNYSGALWDADWISAGDPPLFSAHDIPDIVVPCSRAQPSGAYFTLFLEGSCSMIERANAVNVNNASFFTNNQGHVTYFEDITSAAVVVNQTALFLYNLLCPQINTSCEKSVVKSLFEIYPNPIRDEFSIQTSCLSDDLYVFDTMGKLVKTIDRSSFYKATLPDLPKGVYYFRLRNHPETVKVIKY